MFLNGSQANVTRRIDQIEEVHLPNSPLIKCFFPTPGRSTWLGFEAVRLLVWHRF